ncbi:MAG TPA: EAL domain-containing protein, partial [Gammaproteobacteria bacterium]|nr:EAL domain-containing protein [Gammaproteobacteria bacterium]
LQRVDMSVAGMTASLAPAEPFTILRGLVPGAGAALYGADARLIWAGGLWAPEETVAVANLVLEGKPAATDLSRRLANGRNLHIAPIPAEDPGAEDSFFIVVCDANAGDDVGEAVAAMASVMTTVRRLNSELDGMARELSDRYEELNLIYATSNQETRFTEGQGALDSLVKNCRDHLDASLVALVLPVQGLSFERHDARSPVQHVSEFLRAIASEFFAGFAAAGRAVVCNQDMSGAEELERFGAMKFAATPILNDRQVVCGVLLMVNPADAIDFSNSDRNLLGSIAEKAARIVEASYDSLTGLLCRGEFEHRLKPAHARSRQSGEEHCVLCIGLDQLSVVNETLGHEAGDGMIRCLGNHLNRYQGERRIAARLGSDDFGLLLENCPLEAAREIAETIRLSINALSFSFQDQPIAITASIGVACLNKESESAAAVLQAAELASALAHEKGRNSIHVYQDGATSLVERTEQMRWVGRIHSALRKDRFRLFGQLIQSLDGSEESHVEILLRLIDDDGRVQSPGTFLPAAERYFLMPSIDRWVISHALAMLAETATEAAPLCAINLSGQSMSDDYFIDFILGEFDKSGVPCERICFEITETAAIRSMETAKQFIVRLKERGCQFSLDDFGTGLSSFSYLKALPVDFVKIDGSFVKGIIDDPVSESMVLAITQVGHAMGLKIIAEYVENTPIQRRLKKLGVDYGQGYAIEHPIPLREHLTARRARAVAT